MFVPDLAYDVSSADLLVRGLEFMRRGDVQDLLRSRARFPVADLVEQARQRLERGMNRSLGQNAKLVAQIATGDVLAVRATAQRDSRSRKRERNGPTGSEPNPRTFSTVIAGVHR